MFLSKNDNILSNHFNRCKNSPQRSPERVVLISNQNMYKVKEFPQVGYSKVVVPSQKRPCSSWPSAAPLFGDSPLCCPPLLT